MVSRYYLVQGQSGVAGSEYLVGVCVAALVVELFVFFKFQLISYTLGFPIFKTSRCKKPVN